MLGTDLCLQRRFNPIYIYTKIAKVAKQPGKNILAASRASYPIKDRNDPLSFLRDLCALCVKNLVSSN
jgi:hypothetical protein